MPNNNLKSREREVVKITHGSYKSPHPTGARGMWQCAGGPFQWGEQERVLTEAWGAGMGFCLLPGFQLRLSSPSATRQANQGLDLVSVGCPVHHPFLGLETIVTSDKWQWRLPVSFMKQPWYHFISVVTLEGTCWHDSQFATENKTLRAQITHWWPHSS